MTLSKRPNRKGGFSWVIRWREGKKRYCHTLKDIQDETMANIAFHDFLKQRERGAVGLPTDPHYSLREALGALADTRRGRVKAGQSTQHKVMADRLCRILGENTPVAKLTSGDVGRLRQTYREEKMAPPTINKNVSFLMAAINQAVRKKIIDHNPISVEEIERVSDDRPPCWRFLTEEEITVLFDALEHGYDVLNRSRMKNEYRTHYQASAGLLELVTFLLNTGARLGEALACKWRDVDFKAGHVRLVATKKASRGRSAAPRWIPLNATLRDMLTRLHKDLKPTADDPVLTISKWNIKHQFQNLCERIGLGHMRVHDLRHTFCSHLAMAGVPIPTIRDLAGHSTIQMTMRYSHLSPGKTLDAVSTLNFGGETKTKKAQVVDLAG